MPSLSLLSRPRPSIARHGYVLEESLRYCLACLCFARLCWALRIPAWLGLTWQGVARQCVAWHGMFSIEIVGFPIPVAFSCVSIRGRFRGSSLLGRA